MATGECRAGCVDYIGKKCRKLLIGWQGMEKTRRASLKNRPHRENHKTPGKRNEPGKISKPEPPK
jgi:hypothetical protein